MWRQPEWQRLLLDDRVGCWKGTFCAFQAAWKRPTRVITNSLLRFRCAPCLGCLKHIPLRGYSRKHRMPWTRVAEHFPNRPSRYLGECIAGHAKNSGALSGKFSISDCAKVTNIRIGEASMPGPRSKAGVPRPPRDFPLDDVQLVS